MNSSEIDTRKKRKRSQSHSSESSSRSRRRSKREKRKRHSRSRSKSRSRSRTRSRDRRDKRRKSKKHRSERKKKKRDRSKSQSESSKSEEKQKGYQTIPPMDMMMSGQYFYNPAMVRDPRMRPPFFSPQFPPDMSKTMGRSMSTIIPPKYEGMGLPPMEQLPTDKIVKDQNFLNSDEKLFDSIVGHEMGLRSIFEDCQISEKYLGTYLFKTVKKIVYDPTTIIFESESKKTDSLTGMPKPLEMINIAISEFISDRKDNKINLGDLSNIRDQLINLKENCKQSESNTIMQ